MLEPVPRGAVLYADRLTPPWPQAVVLCSDGRWYPVTLLAWCRYQGGWAALIRWADGSEDWRRHDLRYLRHPAAGPMPQPFPTAPAQPGRAGYQHFLE